MLLPVSRPGLSSIGHKRTMSNLFLIDGASGVWKADLIDYVSKHLVKSKVIPKLTTRTLRENETPSKLDLKFISEEQFATISPTYQYIYAEHRYGFSASDVSGALRLYDSVFVIVRNADVIRRLRHDFTEHNVRTVFIYTDTTEVAKRLPVKRSKRLSDSVKIAFLDYLRSPDLYDDVLVNGSSANDFYRLIDVLISRQSAAHLTRMERPVVNQARPTERFRIVVSPRVRAVMGVILGALTSLSVGFLVNMVSDDKWNYWKYVSTAMAAALSAVFAGLAVLIVLGSETTGHDSSSETTRPSHDDLRSA